MDVLILPDVQAVAQRSALFLEAAVRRHPEAVLGLATGGTMVPVYAAWVKHCAAQGLDLTRCRTFNLDEYLGLGPRDTRSFHAFMQRHLFTPAGMDPQRTRVPDGCAADPAQEAVGYEQEIRYAGGIDLQLLGLGPNGHIGFNEPLSSFSSRSRVVTLTAATRNANARDFENNPEQVPPRALTMGLATILEARRCLLVITGAHKAAMAARVIEGPVTAMVPGSLLHWHADCTVLLDEPAASGLRWRELHDHKEGRPC